LQRQLREVQNLDPKHQKDLLKLETEAKQAENEYKENKAKADQETDPDKKAQFMYLANKAAKKAEDIKRRVKANPLADLSRFSNFVREGTDEKIICYRPAITFKNSEMVVEHIAKCAEGSNRYFDEFGEFSIEEKLDKKANNCECLVNRCVLGLSFSELADYRKKRPERLFECLDTEIDLNGNQLDSLVVNERVSDRINEINSYRNQTEAQIEIIPN